jgi:peptidoglycan/xylan/chitin deacetylase (PgdA/CDA1 family)
MVRSLNTPFYALAERVGPASVRDLAIRLGIPETYAGHQSLVDERGEPKPGSTRADIAIGRYAVAPADLATVYATLAAGGVRVERHVVGSAAGADGATWYTATPEPHRVIGADVAADVTAVLHEVAVHLGQPDGRAAAAKTGSQQWADTTDSQHAWMAGYTPQLAAVVWLGRAQPGPIPDIDGRSIEGDGLPAQMWRDFLADALHGQPSAPLPPAAHLGHIDTGDARPTTSATPTRSAQSPRVAPTVARRPSTSPKPTGSATVAPSPNGPQPVFRTGSEGKAVALTFDDGPSPYTGQILDTLAAHHVKATFCIVGEQARLYPDLVKRVVAEGHAVCNHSMRHDDLSVLTSDQIAADLSATNAAIRAAAPDARISYFRAPYGSWGATATMAAQLGMTAVSWTVDTEDWKTPGVPAILQAVATQLKPRGIVLMHDGGGDRSQSVEALGLALTQLEADGWAFDLPATTASGSAGTPPTTGASPGSTKHAE